MKISDLDGVVLNKIYKTTAKCHINNFVRCVTSNIQKPNTTISFNRSTKYVFMSHTSKHCRYIEYLNNVYKQNKGRFKEFKLINV